MVDRPLCRTNRSILYDSIECCAVPKRVSRSDLKEKYLRTNLSAAQLADETGLSKQAVLTRLRKVGVSQSKGRWRSPENYRFPFAPYGYRVMKGRLEVFAPEMRAVRLIVELRSRQGFAFAKVASQLGEKGYRTRLGAEWTSAGVRIVFLNS